MVLGRLVIQKRHATASHEQAPNTEHSLTMAGILYSQSLINSLFMRLANYAMVAKDNIMTLPKLHLAITVEMIRDGGSFIATFLDESSHEYMLHFQIRHTPEGRFYFPRQHVSASIIDCGPSLRPKNSSRLGGPRTPISWETARKILKDFVEKRLDSTAPEMSVTREEWLQEMIEVANRDGAPDELSV